MIRPATPQDASTVTALAVAAGMFPPDQTEVTDTMMADYFAGNHERGHRCLIDEDARAALGVAYVLPKPATEGTWELLMIAIHPDHQGQGRGAALMTHVENELRSQGARLLLVETSGTPDYARTRAFYVQCGYEEEARVRDYYEAGADMVLFRKALSDA
ncbi:GNAT family N-acetyltransferase [Deinococcus aquaedulcis]|uniref:GNAT family N-acetyltransferase n=1 Tax=Deinococcus aquaedulcis TaxID=2840455 RepID=UPI001C83E7A2|nr:GNAT family N-acetyltransferase [Deinococcus aquaedulcis]